MDTLISRQPVLDTAGHVVAYRLALHGARADAAASDVVDVLMDPILARLTGGRPAVIEIPVELLANHPRLPFGPGLGMIALPSDGGRDDGEVTEIADWLRHRGFKLVLGSSPRLAEWKGNLDAFSSVEVDLSHFGPGLRKALPRSLGEDGTPITAAGVNSWNDERDALAAGYTALRGRWLLTPDLGAEAHLQPTALTALTLLDAVNADDFDVTHVEDVIRRDAALTMELLRYINSAAFYRGTEIRSIRQAVVLLGEREVRRWASLLALSRASLNKPAELLQTAVVRGRVAETVAEATGNQALAAPAFLAGLLTAMDAMLDVPIEQALDQIALTPEVEAAICGLPGPLTDIVSAAQSLEAADWPSLFDACRRVGLSANRLADLSLDASAWANELIPS